ncbi:MAG: hypothetical protein ACKOTD_00170, partial [Phycisphaerales bacterium]
VRLIVMKLLARRPHDEAHIADLWRSGAIDRSMAQRLPESMRARFIEWMDSAERHYGNSPH